jgi:hypothetical protein
LPDSPNQEFRDGSARQSPPNLDNSELALPREIAAGILISPQISALGQKPPILARLVAFIYQFGRIQAEETRSDYRILRLREEEESGDKESQANQTEERKACHQGHLCFLWQADLQDWQAEVGSISRSFLFSNVLTLAHAC